MVLALIEIKVFDNEYDKSVLDVYANEVFIGKILKTFYKKTKIPFPMMVNDLETARSFFHKFEKLKAKNYALFLLSKQSYHSLQLEQKMKTKFISEETIQKVLAELSSYMDDERYVGLKIEQELSRGNSPLGIQKKLYGTGVFVDLGFIKGKVSKDFLKDKIYAIVEKKFVVNGNIDSKKAGMFLVRKGFDYQDIKEVISRFRLEENQLENEP